VKLALPMWLKNLKVTRVALVDKPANPEAEVVIYKAKTPPTPPPSGPSDGTCPNCGAVLKDGMCPNGDMEKDGPGLSDVHSPAPMGGKKKPGLKKPSDTKTDEHDAYKGVTMADETPKNDVVKAAVENAEIKKLHDELEVAKAEKKLLAERVEKIELARRNEVYIQKAKEFDYLPGAQADDLGPLLSKIDAALTEPERNTMWTYLRSANQAIKHSALFGERGVEGIGGLGTSEPEQALQKIARSKMETSDGKLDFAKAYALAIKENPKLYEKYEADRVSAHRR